MEGKLEENKSFATLDTFMVRVIHSDFSNNFLRSSNIAGDLPQTEQLHFYLFYIWSLKISVYLEKWFQLAVHYHSTLGSA